MAKMTKILVSLAVALNMAGAVAHAGSPPTFPPAMAASSDPATLAIRRDVAAADAGAGHAIYTKTYADLDQYWAPEFIVNGPGNKVLTRAQVIAAIGDGKLEYRDYHIVVEAISAIGENVIEMGHEDYVPVRGPETGKTVYRRFTQVYVRRGGRLLLIARQATIYDPTLVHY